MLNVCRPSLDQHEEEAVLKVLRSAWLGMGSTSLEFERTCQNLLGCRHFIATSSCTRALEMSLRSSGIKSGDEVLVPSITYAATVHAVLNIGAVPVFVDSDPSDLNMSPSDLARRLTSRSRCIMPVHYRGRSCNMDAILEVARDQEILVIEDAAQAFGSGYRGTPVGSNSYAACFSFGPIKNITCGEGGGIATNDDDLAAKLRLYRDMGFDRNTWERFSSTGDYERLPCHSSVVSRGDRCHLSDINAAIGLEQIRKLEAFKCRKRTILRAYEAALSEFSEIGLLATNSSEDFLCIFSVQILTGNRDAFMRSMLRRGFTVTVHYDPCHLQPYFRHFAKEPLVVAECAGRQLVSLPSFTDMTDEQVCSVINAVRDSLSDRD
jgi:dTDP-4-amino-4,6-dideoxygalactose transaminase